MATLKKIKLLLVLGLILLTTNLQANTEPLKKLRKGIFKINVTRSAPDYTKPWLSQGVRRASGSGFNIGNGYILTNAHVVRYATYITVKADGQDNEEQAQIAFVADDCDLALLKTIKETYVTGTPPIPLGDIPTLGSTIHTIGYPAGGEQLSMTAGIVSRISYRNYAHPVFANHLVIQVDSAQNPGNSGGPVIQDGKAIGVAFQGITGLEGVNFVIPMTIVKRFLRDIKDGIYDGDLELGISVSVNQLSNPAVRQFYQVPGNLDHGVLIENVFPWSPFAAVLKPEDVLTKIDEAQIGDDGNVLLYAERVSFNAITDFKLWDEPVKLEWYRNGKKLSTTTKLKKSALYYSRSFNYEPPKYFVYAGMVFAPLNLNLLTTWGSKWFQTAPLLLRHAFEYKELEPTLMSRTELPVFIELMNHPINKYLWNFSYGIVDTVNDKKISSLSDLKNAMIHVKEPFIKIEFWHQSHLGPLILSTEKAQKYHQAILQEHRITQSEQL